MPKHIKRIHAVALSSVLAGVLFALASSITFAELAMGTGPGGEADSTWRCPLKEVGSTGSATGKCTSTGCRKTCTRCVDPFTVCAFTASDSETKCPPLEECEKR
jgi:hypothetical protein